MTAGVSDNTESSWQFKGYILCTLTVSTSAYSLLVRSSRHSSDDVPMYSSSTVVMITEVLKCIISTVIVITQQPSVLEGLKLVRNEMIFNPRELAKLAIISVLYMIQNNLAFIALSNLDAATYQVTYQIKLLTSAVFMILLMKKKISGRQWLALFVLFGGISLVQLERSSSSQTSDPASTASYITGMLSIAAMTLCSGFAGVYFEKVLKDSDTSIWVRNMQLYFCGIVVGGVAVYTKDGTNVAMYGFFYGYHALIWLIIGIAVMTGVYVSFIMKYLDNIWKNFSTCFSLIITTMGSVYFGDVIGVKFFIGTFLVMFSIYLYNIQHIKPPPPPAPLDKVVVSVT